MHIPTQLLTGHVHPVCACGSLYVCVFVIAVSAFYIFIMCVHVSVQIKVFFHSCFARVSVHVPRCAISYNKWVPRENNSSSSSVFDHFCT